jgi:hypothetical protein
MWSSSSGVLYVTLLFTLSSLPLVQAILSAGLSALVALFLVTYRPYKERVLNYC